MATDAVPRSTSTRRCAELAAGEKQKLEILKQLYLQPPLPDPRRADLGADARTRPTRCWACCRRWPARGELHRADDHAQVPRGDGFADEVTVLRRGRLAGDGRGGRARRPSALAEMMVGAARSPQAHGHARERPRRRARRRAWSSTGCVRRATTPGCAAVDGVSPRGARRARSSASPASRATASASWSRRWPASAEPAAGAVARRRPALPRHARARSARYGALSLPEEPLRNACVRRA